MAKKPSVTTDAAPENPLITLEFNGCAYTFPRERKRWPSRGLIAAVRRQVDVCAEQLLGPVQWEVLMDSCDGGQLEDFLSAFADTIVRECS